MLGNEGSGMSEKQISLCDDFVYIEQYGTGTASLNVTVAASIVMHHFAVWANYKEAPREGDRAKFLVAEVDRTIPTERTEVEMNLIEQRKANEKLMQEKAEEALSSMGDFFGQVTGEVDEE